MVGSLDENLYKLVTDYKYLSVLAGTTPSLTGKSGKFSSSGLPKASRALSSDIQLQPHVTNTLGIGNCICMHACKSTTRLQDCLPNTFDEELTKEKVE